MNSQPIILLAWISVGFLAAAPHSLAQVPTTNQIWNYLLLPGSYLFDDCPPCLHPAVLEPMRGTFSLVALDENPLGSRYELRHISFTAGSPTGRQYRVVGGGI